MTTTRRRDPAAKADATIASLTLTVVSEETRAAARRYITSRARSEADEAQRLAALGLDRPA